jgi:hypothetical protein
VNQHPLEREDGFFFLSASILGLRIGNVLTGELIFQLHGEEWDPVQEYHHINGVVVLFGIMELTYDRKAVLLIKFVMGVIKGRLGLKIDQLKTTAPGIYPVSKGMNDPSFLDGFINGF